MDELLNEFFKVFSNEELFPEWADMSDEEKVKLLEEAIKDKKDLTQTKIFKITWI